MAVAKKKKSLKNNHKHNIASWPKKEKLVDAVEIFEKFRDICIWEMDAGYWATVDFPSKHHINKILSIQYMDREVLEAVYGTGLIKKTFKLMPYCKHYVQFVKEDKDERVANK